MENKARKGSDFPHLILEVSRFTINASSPAGFSNKDLRMQKKKTIILST